MTAKELEKRLASKAIYATVTKSSAGNFDIEIDDQATLRQAWAISEILETDDITVRGGENPPGPESGCAVVRITAVPKPKRSAVSKGVARLDAQGVSDGTMSEFTSRTKDHVRVITNLILGRFGSAFPYPEGWVFTRFDYLRSGKVAVAFSSNGRPFYLEFPVRYMYQSLVPALDEFTGILTSDIEMRDVKPPTALPAVFA